MSRGPASGLRAVGLALVFGLLVAACAGPLAPQTMRVTSTPVPMERPVTPEPVVEPTVTVEPVAQATAPPTARPTPVVLAAEAPPASGRSIDAFAGLGGWIDVYDYTDDPETILPAVRDMSSKGVRTLYLQVSRFNSPDFLLYPRSVAAALEESHRLGMVVVPWYIMDFQDMERDVNRSIQIIRYTSPNGHRFDAFGANIEREEIADTAERSRRTVEYSRRIREAAPDLPMAAITISPGSLAYNPSRWPGFPWAELAPLYDAFMPMTYWTYRSPDPQTADSRTREDLRETARLTGRPVHAVGGIGDKADGAQVRAYVRASIEEGGIGVSLYDHAVTRPDAWPELQAWPR